MVIVIEMCVKYSWGPTRMKVTDISVQVLTVRHNTGNRARRVRLKKWLYPYLYRTAYLQPAVAWVLCTQYRTARNQVPVPRTWGSGPGGYFNLSYRLPVGNFPTDHRINTGTVSTVQVQVLLAFGFRLTGTMAVQ